VPPVAPWQQQQWWRQAATWALIITSDGILKMLRGLDFDEGATLRGVCEAG